MAKFYCWGVVQGTKYLGEFEADNKHEAIEMAERSDAVVVSVCHQCYDQIEEPEVISVHAEAVDPAPTGESDG